MERGYYRVHLVAQDGDWITLYVPLNEDGWYDRNAPKPHLLKSSWEDGEYYGELVVTGERFNRIIWADDYPDSLTDILRAPIHDRAIFTVFETDDRNSERWTFTVKDIRRL